MRRVSLAMALGVVLAAVLALAPAASAKRVLVAFMPTTPAPKLPLLFDLEQRNFSYGLMSSSIGAFDERQMLLDTSQGTRISNTAYTKDIGRLDLEYGPNGGRIVGWFYDNRRAKVAPGEVEPGLFAETLQRAGRHVAYAGVVGFEQTEAAVAANRAGEVESVSLGTEGTFAQRTLDLLETHDVVVARFPRDDAGLESLDRIVADRRPDDLIFALRAPPPAGARLLPAGILGPRFRGNVLYSPTTRRPGLVADTDIAPTVLHYLGVRVPKRMEGRVIHAEPDGDAAAVSDRIARLDVLVERRAPALRSFALAFLIMSALLWFGRRREGLRMAGRIGFLGALWLPGMALVTAGLAPSRTDELLLLSIGSLVLGAITDRLLPWPLAPALPAALVFGAHAVDLASGSPLVGASLTGSNPKGGARFFGVGNELEAILAIEVMLGLGAALTRVPPRWVPRLFALGGLVAAAVIGSGRLGADVGGVITIGAGTAGAVLASLGGRLTLRRLAVFVLVPVAAVLALVVLDLATGGDAHLTRTIVHGNGPGEWLDVAQRRFTIALRGLQNTPVAIIVAIGIFCFALALKNRRRLFAPLDAHPAFMAGIWGGFSATVVGALSNDSGPVLFSLGFLGLLFAVGYVRGRPGAARETARARFGAGFAPGPSG